MGVVCSTTKKTKPESSNPLEKDLEKPSIISNPPKKDLEEPSTISNPPKKDLEEPSITSNPPKKDLEEPLKPSLKPEIPANETSFTFKVDPVEFAKGFNGLVTAEDIIRKEILSTEDFDPEIRTNIYEFKGRLEDFSHRKDEDAKYLSAKVPGLVGVIHSALESHYALSLSANDFIIMIGQGLGLHINVLFGEKGFFEHEGELSIEVRRNNFVLGGQNDWSTIFDEIAEQIQGKIKADVYEVIRDNTSVATTLSRIVSETTLNIGMQNYFLGEVETSREIPEISCGIPEITLEGVPEDWQKLKDKVRKLVEMNKDDCLGLKEWLDQLVPVVDKVCEAGIERKVDREFWSRIYKYDRISGGDRINGWITRFFRSLTNFPLDKNFSSENIRAIFISKQAREMRITWNDHENKIPMIFTSGFLGAEVNKDLRQVKAAHFWCVRKEESG